MIIARIANATRVLGKAQGYIGLPIRDEKGAFVQLCILGTGHPPVMIEVGEVPE